MRVGLEHIDPIIGVAMRERLCAPGTLFLKDNIRWADAEETSLIRLFVNQALRRPEQRQPDEAERLAYLVHRQREKMALQRAQITLAGTLLGGGLIGMLFYTLTTNLWIGITVGVLIGVTALVAGGYWVWQATSRHELYYELTLAEFQSVVPLLALTDAEAAYCDLLTRVCEHDPNQEARRAVRRHITKLKEFVTLGRQLDLLADAAAQNELAALQDRIEAARDGLIEAIHGIADALCAILVVPSPAGDRASERIERELQTYRQVVEALTTEVTALQPTTSKRRREKVS
jgi:hypothetical protein